jgi:dTDP-4-dehydrorhamnose reductase
MLDLRGSGQTPERLVITGVDGVVGANLAAALAERFAVLGLHHSRAAPLDVCPTAHWAPCDRKALTTLLREVRPQWILHCGPLARGSWDLPDEAPDAKDERRACLLLAELAAQFEARLTVLSTDAVFAGPRMFHVESGATTSRLRPFARAALQVERALQKTAALVVRTHAYGWSPVDAEPGFAEQVWQALGEGTRRGFAADRHATPILATDLAGLLHRAYVRGLAGVCHLAGAERASQYRFAVELAMAFGLKGPVVSSEESPATAGRASRLRETSLDSTRVRGELDASLPLLREGLARFAEQARSGFRARLQTRRQPLAA